jgi:hypothetical protein
MEVINLKWSLTINGDESEVRELERLARMLRKPMVTQELESKYSPLQDFLIQKKEEGETNFGLTMEEIQEIIQTDLPPSAQKHDSFWRDRRRNIGAHIVKAGWHIGSIERNQEDGQIEKIQLHVCTKRHKKRDRHSC